jgi:hypothetical protein
MLRMTPDGEVESVRLADEPQLLSERIGLFQMPVGLMGLRRRADGPTRDKR